MRVALAQVNPTVGALEANAALVIERIKEAEAAGADIVAFPELVISGYPPEDLLLKDHFVGRCWSALLQVAAAHSGVCALVGVPVAHGAATYNSAAVVAGGRIAGVYRKICLPNYAVFDEKRYFTSGDRTGILDLAGARVGINICEDIWEPCGPTVVAAREGDAGLVINLSMSPYHVGKGKQREAMLSDRARDAGAYVCYVNGVGGQDELVFDGESLVFGPDGALIARAKQFEEQLLIVDLDVQPPRWALSAESGGHAGPPSVAPGDSDADCRAPSWPIEIITVEKRANAGRSPAPELAISTPEAAATPRVEAVTPIAECLSVEAEIYAALCLGTRDYVRKNRFERVVMGISGGIDSALTACIAADALGTDKVNAVSMPSRYSSMGTKDDARETAQGLGVHSTRSPSRASMAPTWKPSFRISGMRRLESPSRTSKPASGATSLWRFRTSSATSCSRREQERDRRAATRRSTAIWPAASRC